MRHRQLTVVLACAALSALGLAAPRPASALLPGDLSLAKAGRPTTLYVNTSPALVLYQLTVSASDILVDPATDITITDTIPDRTTYRDEFSSPECSAADSRTVTCFIPGPVNAGGAASVEIVVEVPPTLAGTTIVNRAVARSPSEPSNRVGANNVASASTPVVFDANRSNGFVAPGASLSLASRSGRAGAYTMTAPSSSKGAVVDLGAEDPTVYCQSACLYQDAVRADPDTTLAGHQVTDPNHPLVLALRLGTRRPCRGIGGDDPCFNLRYVKPGQAGRIVPFCTGAGPGSSRGPGIADPSPCKNHQFKTPTGEINFEILMLSADPSFY